MPATTLIETINPADLQRLMSTGYELDLIDVRTPAEFREVHAVGARNVPLDELSTAQLQQEHGENAEPIYFICRSDARGRKACEAFHAAGYNNVVNVAGGTIAWNDLGLPVERGPKTVSLDRQVRITAGLLVILGVVLGLTIHPAWSLLAGLVGAGLTYAGLTDSCGMARLLSQMPWNRVSVQDPPA